MKHIYAGLRPGSREAVLHISQLLTSSLNAHQDPIPTDTVFSQATEYEPENKIPSKFIKKNIQNDFRYTKEENCYVLVSEYLVKVHGGE